MIKEDNVKTQIMDFYKKLKSDKNPIYMERRIAIGIGYKVGLPDLWGIYNGRHFEIELKGPDGKRSSVQIKREKELTEVGAAYAVIDNLEDFKEFLNKLKSN